MHLKKMMLPVAAIISITLAATPVFFQQYTTQKPACTYIQMKQQIAQLRKQLGKVESNNKQIIEEAFAAVVVDSIIPYWYGTRWDFNGTTQQPGTGAIACGYFVSTVLRDAGLNVNRVKTGQAASQVIIRQFADKASIKTFYQRPLDTVLAYIRTCGKGLFIVGLDNHTGFIVYDNAGVWFIHAKWANPCAVVKEIASSSGILYYSRYRMVGKVSGNKKLLQQWLQQF